MTEINAKVIADSISDEGHRLTTIEATYPRFIHSEVMTHRVFSRNAASSRAIPLNKTIERVRRDPAMPVAWPREKKGMQGGEELVGQERDHAYRAWFVARMNVIDSAMELQRIGLHKSVVNRILEPWMWMTTIITSTEWDGYWHQRTHEAAMPEFQVVASMMKDAYDKSEPMLCDYGDWHMPYIDVEDWTSQFFVDEFNAGNFSEADFAEYKLDVLKRVSVARCARVSYLTHFGSRSIKADLDLYRRLTHREEWISPGVPKDPIHWSPLEHVATPCTCHVVADGHKGNFGGWDQLRHYVEAEVRKALS